MHQVINRALWPVFDPAVWIAESFVCAMYVAILVREREPIHRDARMICNFERKGGDERERVAVVWIGQRRMRAEETDRMLRVRNVVNVSHRNGLIGFYIMMYIYMYSQLIINSLYTVTLGSVVFWLVGQPAFMFYAVYAVFSKSAYVIAVSEHLQVRQRSILARFIKLNKETQKDQQDTITNEAKTATHTMQH